MIKNYKKNHCVISLTAILFLFVSAVSVAGVKSFKGTIVPLSTVKIYGGFDNEYKGIITYTPLPGTLFKGPILDLNGKIIKHGDVLFRMETEYRDAQVEQAKAAIDKDGAALDSAKALYLSSKKLHEHNSGAISEIDFIKARNGYFEALSQLETDKASLILADKMRSICTYYARFDGIVNKVYFPYGYLGTFGEPTLEVSQLAPIAVDIKMSREEAYSINSETSISVYPVDVKAKPVGVFVGRWKLTNDGIEFLIPNYIATPKVKKIDNGKEVPVLNKISGVIAFNLDPYSDLMGINRRCMQKDEKGYFVFTAINRKTAQPGKPFNPLMKIKKVYITPGNRINPIGPNADLISLKDKGTLELYDVVFYPSECKELKDNDTVYYMQKRYIFMPGDMVKVEIENMK